jgi:hypothetical protein
MPATEPGIYPIFFGDSRLASFALEKSRREPRVSTQARTLAALRAISRKPCLWHRGQSFPCVYHLAIYRHDLDVLNIGELSARLDRRAGTARQVDWRACLEWEDP